MTRCSIGSPQTGVPARRLASALIVVAMIALATTVIVTTQDQQDRRGDDRRRERFTHTGGIVDEAPAADGRNATSAPTGFDNQTNGMDPQGPEYDTLNEDTVVALRSFNDNRFIFEEVESM